MSTMDVAEAPQHLKALGRANEVRVARSELKRKIKTFEVDVCDVIMDPPWEAEGMTVEAVLMALPRFGRHRVMVMIGSVCRPTLLLETMGVYTRRRLCERIDDRLGRPYTPR